MEDIIEEGLEITSSGSWFVSEEELNEKNITLEEFCNKLDKDERISEYEIEPGGIFLFFWLKYCKNLDLNWEEE